MTTHELTSAAAWEAHWAPYDLPTYCEALDLIPPGSTVLDIGAGDLRFARLAADRAAYVYAIERRLELLTAAQAADFPANIIVVCADARHAPFPRGVDTAVLLMRHCREFGRYARKLTAAGCRYLITNARWGMGVERMALGAPLAPHTAGVRGWYACRCGRTGFREFPPEQLTPNTLDTTTEVAACPACRPAAATHPQPVKDGPRW